VKPLIGISLGDAAGIGPEVVLKAVAALGAEDDCRFLLLGDTGQIHRMNASLGLNLAFTSLAEAASGPMLRLHEPAGASLPDEFAPGSPAVAKAALAWLTDGAQRALRGEIGALVTAPVNKEAILRTGQPFVGQTEFLAQLAGTGRVTMMLLGHDERGRWLRVALATTHLPLRNVAEALRTDRIETAIELAAQACHDLGLDRARIGVCGLNPHAGEGGQLGDEEQTLIAPAIETARRRGCDASGPFAADTLFHHAWRGDFDAVVAMYHDQGLAPLKLIAFDTGVNWTLGLPFIRTSPDHGTAYDIAGRGVANPSSMIAAIRLAKQLVQRRKE
jgi:4-hydroxythreonine-4-phosphate dehydrogenase